MRRILIAMEGAACSEDAIQQVARVFPPEDLMVFVLVVIPPVKYPLELVSGAPLYHWQSEEALVALDRATAAMSRAGFAAFGLIRIGEPGDCILGAAQELEADVIWLATHGRKGAKRLISTSVAESVASKAPCDVMLDPLDGEGPHGSLEHPAA